jgi:nitrogen fixation protein NifB
MPVPDPTGPAVYASNGLDLSVHPCFGVDARARYGRVHLPVALTCNVQCNYCDRRYDCVNESRPGVTSAALSPEQAADYVDEVVERAPSIRVVGIAGPGDPMADAERTLRTLELVRERHRDLLLCLATNGLELARHCDALAAFGVSHVTVTVNAVDPEIAGRVYAWVRRDGERLVGEDAGAYLWEAQQRGIAALVRRRVLVKVNTVVIPGVNQDHVIEVARTVARLGATRINCLPLRPVANTPFGRLAAPRRALLRWIRSECARYLPPMDHCAHCRADAVGLIGHGRSSETTRTLWKYSQTASPVERGGPEDSGARPEGRRDPPATDECRVADLPPTEPQSPAVQPRDRGLEEGRRFVGVLSRERLLVNLHLGEAERVFVFAREDDGFRLVDTRLLPRGTARVGRWQEMGNLLSDCSTLLVSGAGTTAKAALATAGLEVIETEGLIEDALDAVFEGRPLPRPRRMGGFRCGRGTGCNGTGTLCG